MNFSNILNHIATVDPEVYERTSARRSVIRTWMRGAALTALPVAIGGLFNKAYGKNTDAIGDVLNFALTLEYLEAEFYRQGLIHSDPPNSNMPLIPATTGIDQPAIRTIYAHEAAHVAGLRSIIQSLGQTPVNTPNFDFSGGKGSGVGPFQNVFTDYNVFLSLAQAFEDTGVRAYKGAAPLLMSNHPILTAALRIHSVEGRHASHIRTMRRLTPSSYSVNTVNYYPRPWITGADSEIVGVDVSANYNGEDNTLQASIQILNINGNAISQAAATQSFDEPLDMPTVLGLVSPFIAP